MDLKSVMRINQVSSKFITLFHRAILNLQEFFLLPETPLDRFPMDENYLLQKLFENFSAPFAVPLPSG